MRDEFDSVGIFLCAGTGIGVIEDFRCDEGLVTNEVEVGDFCPGGRWVLLV